MRSWLFWGCVLLAACGTEPAQQTPAMPRPAATTAADTPVAMPADMDSNFARDTSRQKKPPAAVIQKPSGTYQLVLPLEEGEQVLHTIAFYPGTFRMQEAYGKDSVVVTQGTWAPSRDFIWAYKDQVVRSRYTWKEDTLLYYSPQRKKTFAMQKLTPATQNAVWKSKQREGQRLYGIGTEPFWSVEITKNDSMIVNMPDWKAPLRTKLTEAQSTADSAVFSAGGDSLRLVVYPYFCSDGMSDFVYTQKLALQYRGQTYRGCGEFLQPAH